MLIKSSTITCLAHLRERGKKIFWGLQRHINTVRDAVYDKFKIIFYRTEFNRKYNFNKWSHVDQAESMEEKG